MAIIKVSAQQRQILMFLSEVHSGINHKELAEAIDIPSSSCRVQLTRLKALGLVNVIGYDWMLSSEGAEAVKDLKKAPFQMPEEPEEPLAEPLMAFSKAFSKALAPAASVIEIKVRIEF